MLFASERLRSAEVKVLKQTEGKSQIELQVWYRFAPLEGMPGNSVNFKCIAFSISTG